MHEMAGRIRLHGDLQQFPRLAESCGRERKVLGIEMRLEVTGIEAETAFVSAPRADESLLRERRRRDAGDRRPARMKTLVPGAVLQKLQTAGSRRKRDALRHRELPLGQAHQ